MRPNTSAKPRTASQVVGDLRSAIEKALAEGAASADLVLTLTQRDNAALRRDPSVPLEDVSFLNGEMRYLGVRVEAGAVSGLSHPAA